MKNFRALIKGTPVQARKAAMERGTEFSLVKYSPRTNETICDLKGSLMDIIDWYHEDNNKNMGYNPGSLLFYTF